MALYDPAERLNWKQACEVLGCGKSMLYRLVREGQLPAHGVGRRGRWYLRCECEILLKQENMDVTPLDKLTY